MLHWYSIKGLEVSLLVCSVRLQPQVYHASCVFWKCDTHCCWVHAVIEDGVVVASAVVCRTAWMMRRLSSCLFQSWIRSWHATSQTQLCCRAVSQSYWPDLGCAVYLRHVCCGVLPCGLLRHAAPVLCRECKVVCPLLVCLAACFALVYSNKRDYVFVFTCAGADSLAGDRLGKFNLTIQVCMGTQSCSLVVVHCVNSCSIKQEQQ